MKILGAVLQAFSGLVVLSLLFFTSCNNSRFQADPSQRTQPGESQPEVYAEFSLDQALKELSVMSAPPGADPAIFNSLKEALSTALAGSGAIKWASTAPMGERNQVWDLADSFTQDGESAVQWNYLNVGDYDLNSQVNIADITPIALHFRKTPESADWNTAAKYADGDGNGEVNVADITPIAQNFLATVATWQLMGSESEDGPFTPIQEVPFNAGDEIEPSGQRYYNIAPENEYSFYRVAPLDESGTAGQESLTSRGLILFDNVIILNQEGGLAFSDWPEWDTITLEAPDGNPADLEVGDILLSNDLTGVLFAVDSFTQDGNIITAKGHRPYLTEVVVQGALDINYIEEPPAAGSKVTSDGPYLHLDLSGERISIGGNDLQLYIPFGYIDFLPRMDFKMSYNREWGLVYFYSAVTYDKLDISATYQEVSNLYQWQSGNAQSSKNIFSFPFTVRTVHNGIPIAANANLNLDAIFRISRGSGDFLNDSRVWAIDTSLAGLRHGLQYRMGQWEQVSDSSWSFDGVNIPAIDPWPSDDSDREAEVELLMNYVFRLYSPSYSEYPSYEFVDFDIGIASNLFLKDRLRFEEDYILTGKLNRSVNLNFTLFSRDQVVEDLLQTSQVYKSGYFSEPGETYSIGGTVTLEGTGEPLPGVEVTVRESASGNPIRGTSITDENGVWVVTGLQPLHSFRATPELTGYLFDPLNRDILLQDYTSGVDFTALDDPGLHNLTGSITGDAVNDVEIVVYDNATNEILYTLNTYDTGAYSAMHIPNGTEVRVVPFKTQVTFTPASSIVLMDGDKVQDFAADTSLQRFTVSGSITAGGSPLADVSVEVRDSTTSDLLGSDTTDGLGDFSIGNILTGTEIVVAPDKFGYSFTPPSATLMIDADKTQDFTAEQVNQSDWLKTCGGIGYENTRAIAYGPNNNGLQVVAGQLSGSGEGQFIGFVEQRTDSGYKLWHYHYAPPAGSQYCWINDIAVDPVYGDTFCVGVAIPNGSTKEKLWFLHLDWQLHVLRSYTWPDADVTARGSGIEFDTTGEWPPKLYITGDIEYSSDAFDRGPLLMRLEEENYNIVWTKMLGLDKASYVYASALDNDMNLAFAGDFYSGGTSGTDHLAGKINADGTLKWAGVYDIGNSWTYANGMCIGPGNEIYVCGSLQSSGFVLKINDSTTSGTLDWGRQFKYTGESFPATSFFDCAYDAANSALLVCGAQAHPTDSRSVASLLKFDEFMWNLLDGTTWTHTNDQQSSYFTCMEFAPGYHNSIMLGGHTLSASGAWAPATGTITLSPPTSTMSFSTSLQDLSHSFVDYAVIDDFMPSVTENSGGGSEDAINARIRNFDP